MGLRFCIDIDLLVGFHRGKHNRPAYDPEQVNMDELFVPSRTLDVAEVNVLELSLEDQVV